MSDETLVERLKMVAVHHEMWESKFSMTRGRAADAAKHKKWGDSVRAAIRELENNKS